MALRLFSFLARPFRSDRDALMPDGRPKSTAEPGRLLLVLAVILATFYLQDLSVFRAMEHRLYDARVRMLASQYVISSDIIVVAIDEDSLRELAPSVGRWPWPRAVMGSVVDYCSQASVIGLDILYPEGDWQYQRSDDLFVEAVTAQGNVINAVHLNHPTRLLPLGEALSRLSLSDASWNDWQPEKIYGGVLAPFPELLDASSGIGHVNTAFDEDGVLRRHAVVARVGEHVFPSFALAAAMRHLDLAPEDVEWRKGKIRAGEREIPVDAQGRFRICPSKWDYERYRIVDVIRAWQADERGETPLLSRDAFKGKIVLVGSLATGLLEDKKATPLSVQTGGVEVLTAALQDILRGTYITTAPGSSLFLIAMLALAPASRRLSRPLAMLPGALLLALFFVVVCLAALFSLACILPMSGPLLGLVLSAVLLGSIGWYEERRERRRMETVEEARQQWTQMAVHDLRNALTPVVMALSAAEGREGSAFMRDMFLPIVKDSSDLLLCQINALLDARKLQEGRMVLRKRACSAFDLIDPIAREFCLVAGRAGRSLDIQFDRRDDTVLRVDREIMDRVFRNLLWNAIKYSPADTVIEVALNVLPDAIEIIVRNHCERITAEEQAMLFEPFRIGKHASTLGQFHSIGLGLAFCKLAVESHDGSVVLCSPCAAYGEGDGVEFTISLPR